MCELSSTQAASAEDGANSSQVPGAASDANDSICEAMWGAQGEQHSFGDYKYRGHLRCYGYQGSYESS